MKMTGSYSTIAFHIERTSLNRRGKQRFSLPEGGEKTLHYECLSLKSGEHYVDIRHPFKYLGFAWSVKYYVFTVFTVLIFGLTSACYIYFSVV